VLFESTLADAAGRRVASRVDAVVISLKGTRGSGDVTVSGGSLEAARALVASAEARRLWAHDAALDQQRMASVRLEREKAILMALQQRRAERQPGLFDRRAERTWADADDRGRAVIQRVTDRMARVERAGQAFLEEPRLALILVAR
jgi:hypothetical protein